PHSSGGRRRLTEVAPGVLTGDPTMRRVARRCERLVGHATRVLLQGESGTGRKTLARMLSQGRRSQSSPGLGGVGEINATQGLLPPILPCSASTRISDIDDLFDRVRTTPAIGGHSSLGPLVILESIDELSPETQAALL